MLYIPKIDDCLKMLTDNKLKDIVVINLGECFKSTRKIAELLRKVAELIFIFLATPDEVHEYGMMMQSRSSDYYVL